MVIGVGSVDSVAVALFPSANTGTARAASMTATRGIATNFFINSLLLILTPPQAGPAVDFILQGPWRKHKKNVEKLVRIFAEATEEGSVPGSLRGYDAVRHGRRGRGGVL